MKQLNNGSYRYKNITIEPTPLEKFPEMVTIVKTQAKMKELLGKKFITLEKAVLNIDALKVEKFIDGGVKNVDKEIESILVK